MVDYIKTEWKDWVPSGSVPARYRIFDDTNGEIASSADIALITGASGSGTEMNAVNLNHMEQGIYDAHVLAEAAQETADLAIPKNTATESGQVLVSDGAGSFSVLSASGNKGKALISDGITWVLGSAGNLAGVHLRQSSFSLEASETGVQIEFSESSAKFDTDNFFDFSLSATRITIPAGLGGTYMFVLQAWTSHPGDREMYVRKNGTTRVSYADWPACTNENDSGYLFVPGITFSPGVVAGDYFEVIADNLFAGTKPINMTEFTAIRLFGD